MKLAGCFNGLTTIFMSNVQGKFDFSCHDPFNYIVHDVMFFFFTQTCMQSTDTFSFFSLTQLIVIIL